MAAREKRPWVSVVFTSRDPPESRITTRTITATHTPAYLCIRTCIYIYIYTCVSESLHLYPVTETEVVRPWRTYIRIIRARVVVVRDYSETLRGRVGERSKKPTFCPVKYDIISAGHSCGNARPLRTT